MLSGEEDTRNKRDFKMLSKDLTDNESMEASLLSWGPDAHDLEKAAERRAMLRHSLVVLLVYIGVGVLYFTSWGGVPTTLDALFFVTVTVTTVGYGATPHKDSDGVKLFTCAYVFLGVFFVASLLSFVLGLLLDRQEHLLAEAMEATAARASGPARQRREQPQREQRWWLPKPPQHWSAERYHFWSAAALLCAFVLLGALCYMATDGMTFVDALYLTIVSVTTVGYGDEAPTTDRAKIFSICYLPVATMLLGRAVSALATRNLEEKAAAMRARVMHRHISRRLFRHLDTDGDGKISKFEFVIASLEDEGKLEAQVICTQPGVMCSILHACI